MQFLCFVYPSRISVFSSGEATNELQMLLKTVRYTLGNLQTCLEIKQPNEVKFKRLRKGNPPIKRKILNFTAAIEILPWLALWKRLYRKAEEHRNVMTQASCGLPSL
ncbi:WLM domain-containing protein [Raphanus sativus]|nr:WLM domain-containing protein [Raphanus sativus]